MAKEKENRYPGLIPISPDLKRAIDISITVPWIITPFFLAACQRPKPAAVEAVNTSTRELVPTYTPTPKIEVTPTPQPEATPIPRVVITLNFLEVKPEERLDISHDISQQYPEVWEELPSRVEKVLAYQNEPIELTDFPAYKDFEIFERYGIGERNLPLTKENLISILAWYELEYAQPIEQNPNFQQAVKEMVPALRVVNEIIQDKLSPEDFRGQKIPQIPEIIQGNLLFGTDNRGHRFFPEIYVIEEMKDSNPGSYQHLLEYLAGVVPHELIHAWPQALSIDWSSWIHEKDYEIKRGDTLWDISQEYGLKVEDILEKNPQIENPDLIFPEQIIKIPQKGEFIFPENRRFHLAHMSMCSLTAPVQEKLGFEPGIEPRIIYIYSRLKENGVKDPYGLIIRAGTTMKSDRLWEVYEGVRKEGDLSLDELISTNDPVPGFDYYTSQERDTFRAEYAPYLTGK